MFFPSFQGVLQQKGCGESFRSPHLEKCWVVPPVTGCEGYPIGKNCVSQ